MVRIVVDPIPQRHIDRVIPAPAHTDIRKIARTGKEIAVFVERNGHYAVGGVEGLFDTVAVVCVDV
jgi:hypothetical protein